ncbi:MAG TPA: hypothetical protein VJJ23_06430 [Candidatus Nanoarchaeia archaeon]|nr:hypothetical protein [Candidatus Nanoarchaeia archaeon]
MMFQIIIFSVISFLVTLIMLPKFIRYLTKINLVVKDQNKENLPLIPISGGMAVLAGISASLLLTVFLETFYNNGSQERIILIFAALSTILIITFIGFIDDLIIKTSRESSSGLKQWQKPLLTLPATIPLIVANAGVTIIAIPFYKAIDVGLIYPLILVPIGIIGAANMVNLLAGFNGSEAGMGLVYTGMLGLYAFVNNRDLAAILAFSTFAALLAFFIFNKYPSKIFPGDSLTYLLGAVIATIAIIGNIEKAALIASTPFFIEFILKARSKFKAQSYGFFKDGKVQSKYDKIYSIPHILTRSGKYTEKQVMLFMIVIELFFSSLIWIL